MPSSYSLFHMAKFPEVDVGEVIVAPRQLPIEFPTDKTDEPPKTEFTLQRRIQELSMSGKILAANALRSWLCKAILVASGCTNLPTPT